MMAMMMTSRPVLFAVIFAVQLVCASVFLFDIVATIIGLDIRPIDWRLRELIEIGAAIGLIIGAGIGGYMLLTAHQNSKRLQGQLRVASGAFMDVMNERFTDWKLTPAERDVALFSIKGMTTAEIADLRQTSEGTVKAQTNAIYRKAGVSGRAQLLGLFIEDLMADALVSEKASHKEAICK